MPDDPAPAGDSVPGDSVSGDHPASGDSASGDDSTPDDDASGGGWFEGLGPEGAPADARDDEVTEAASQVFAEYAHLTEAEERYEPPPSRDDTAGAGAAEASEAPPGTDLPPPPEAAPELDLPDPAPAEQAPPLPRAAPPPAAPPPAAPTPGQVTPPRTPGPVAPAPARLGDTVVPAEAARAAARAVVRRALDEDLDVVGDLTAEATIPPDTTGRARLVARADGVVAGLDLVALVYDHLDPRVEVRAIAADGDRVRRGDVVAEVSGPLRSVLSGERTALNLVTHLSGVATSTARFVAAVAGTGATIRDTRKTTPGLRLLEKAAVRAGGGANHRLGLSDALLVKDNHVAAAGGVAEATRAALAGARGRHVQVEVDSLEELELAVGAGARDVLLDNFDPDDTARAVARVRELEATHGRILVESSGGLDLDTVRAFAEAGVDRLAIGALTHSAPQLDLALDLDLMAPPPAGAAGVGDAGPAGSGAGS